MIYGYARVSTQEQSLQMQIDALKQAGCETIYYEKISTRCSHRPEFEKLCTQLQKGDKVLTYKLDRLGRSVIDLVQIVYEFEQKGVGFTSLIDNIDTTSASGKLVFHVLCSVAEFERSLISERTKDGIQAAQKRGVTIGRPRGIEPDTLAKITACKRLISESTSITAACSQIGISRSTFYRYVS